ncbi:hypothetical protein ABPG74_012130 [Tetrahymena malaccensis]
MSQKKFERAQSCENSYQHQSGVSEEAQFINKPEKELKFDVKNNIQMNQEEHILFEHKNQISQLQQKNTSNQNQDHLIRKNDYQISQNIIQVEGQIDLIQNDSLENNLNVQKISKIECSKSEYVKDLTNKMTQDQLFNEEINISSNSSNSDSEDQQYQILNVSLSYQEQFYDRLIQNPQISQDSQFPNQINSSSGYMGSIHMNECEIEDNQNKLIPQNEKLQQDFISDQHSHTIHKKYKLNVSKQAKQDILKKDEDFTKKLQDQKKRILQEKLFEKLYKQDQYELIQKQDYLSKLFREQAQLICQKLREKKYILKKFNESIASLDIFFGYSKEDRKQDLVFLIKYFDQDQQPSYIQQEPTQGDQQTLQNNSLNCSSFYDKLKEITDLFDEDNNKDIPYFQELKLYYYQIALQINSYKQFNLPIKQSQQFLYEISNCQLKLSQYKNALTSAQQSLHLAQGICVAYCDVNYIADSNQICQPITATTPLTGSEVNCFTPDTNQICQPNPVRGTDVACGTSSPTGNACVASCSTGFTVDSNQICQPSPLSGYDVPCGTPSSTGNACVAYCNTDFTADSNQICQPIYAGTDVACGYTADANQICQQTAIPGSDVACGNVSKTKKLIACAIYLDNTPEMSYTNCCSQPLDKNCSDQMQSRRCPYCKASGNFQVAENISDYSRAYN